MSSRDSTTSHIEEFVISTTGSFASDVWPSPNLIMNIIKGQLCNTIYIYCFLNISFGGKLIIEGKFTGIKASIARRITKFHTAEQCRDANVLHIAILELFRLFHVLSSPS